MLRRALLLALVTATACKQALPPGDPPPATTPPTATGNPHAGMAAGNDPHAGTAAGNDPHAGTAAGNDPHAGMAAGSDPHAGTAAGNDPHAGTAAGNDPHAGMAAGSDPHAGTAAGNDPHAGTAAGNDPHAGTATPHAAASEPTAPRTLEALPDGRLALGPFSLAAPRGWTARPTTSSMRAAQFTLPGKPGADAELIVYYFGAKGAGSVDDNLDRWLGQFEQPDGKKSRDVAKIEHPTYAGQDATFVSVSGHFQAPAMPGGPAAFDKQDQALLAAIVASPSGPYYFKLVGARPTVEAHGAAFRAMLGSLKLR